LNHYHPSRCLPLHPGTGPIRKEIVALLEALGKKGVAESIVAARKLTPESSTETAEGTVCRAILAKTTPAITGVNPTIERASSENECGLFLESQLRHRHRFEIW
jgi:hypothetical protein